MSDVPADMIMDHHARLSLWEKLITLGTWVLAAWLFMSVGWPALAPDDPQAAVSLFARRGAWMMALIAAGLAALTAGFATILASKSLIDVGAFAACVGMVAASTRGGTAASFVLGNGPDATLSSATVARSFLLEAVAWSLVVPIPLIVSGMLSRRRVEGDRPWHGLSACQDVLGWGLPDVPSLRTDRRMGLKHIAWTTGATLAAWFVLSADPFSRSVQHGQAIFVAAASVGLGSYVAHRASPVHSAAWSVMGAVLASWIGFTWAMFAPASALLPAAIPASRFLRVLPIQSIFAGVGAAILMGWYYVGVGHIVERKVVSAQPSASRTPR